ncbi:MAG: hypothetical protein HY880_05155 [Deltaproteobacteria bacterium]|nr:hypothetical protein [Deltaproteobacteria bacterium]
MQKTVEGLRQQKMELLRKLAEVGNFRRGTLSVNYRKCGKKNCSCAQPGQPKHGPQFLWSTTLKGKSYTKNLALGPQLQKYKEEIDNYHEFQRLCEELIKVNEKLCNLLPVGQIENTDELEELKKNLKQHFMKKYRERLTGS